VTRDPPKEKEKKIGDVKYKKKALAGNVKPQKFLTITKTK